MLAERWKKQQELKLNPETETKAADDVTNYLMFCPFILNIFFTGCFHSSGMSAKRQNKSCPPDKATGILKTAIKINQCVAIFDTTVFTIMKVVA